MRNNYIYVPPERSHDNWLASPFLWNALRMDMSAGGLYHWEARVCTYPQCACSLSICASGWESSVAARGWMKIIGRFPDSVIPVVDDPWSIEGRVIGSNDFLNLPSNRFQVVPATIAAPNCDCRLSRPLGRYLDRFQENPKSVVARRDWTSPQSFGFYTYISRHWQTCVRHGEQVLYISKWTSISALVICRVFVVC